MENSEFTDFIWQKSKELYRDMPWRDEPVLYNVLVSELMLQQTQVARVRIKYDEFMARFPTIEQLAGASLGDVLRIWQGLGYNRRAKYLHEAAKQVVIERAPKTKSECMKLPGIGENTAGAIMAYVYNQPEVFIETNIRTVYLHHFFADRGAVDDKELRVRVAATVDHEHPREFYWGLMDYGTWLKASGVRNIFNSKHYGKQSALKGSVREVRGQIVKALAASPLRESELLARLQTDKRFAVALDGLLSDGLIEIHNEHLQLTK